MGGEPGALRYKRDALGRIVKETVVSGGVTTVMEYGWDQASNLTQVFQNATLVLTYTYDPMDRVSTIRDDTPEPDGHSIGGSRCCWRSMVPGPATLPGPR